MCDPHTHGRVIGWCPRQQEKSVEVEPVAAALAMTKSATPQLVKPLLSWYDGVRRDLPFRKTRDPYVIWISEVMLQQTQVSTMLPYFERWLRRFPDVGALARASEDDVLHAFQGLGYYSRARSLHRAARKVLEEHDGEFPSSAAGLRELPGIGPYSAGAIASIAFQERVPVVDGNVVRVLCRFFGWFGDPSRAPLKQRLWDTAAKLVPADRPGDFNQALMELGATHCAAKRPACLVCPLKQGCQARELGLTARLPETRKPPPVTEVKMAAALILDAGRVAVVKLLPSAARWASMWQFPNVEVGADETLESAAERAARELAELRIDAGSELTTVRHSVTRYRITLTALSCRLQKAARVPKANQRPLLVEELAWKRVRELQALAMPAAHRRLAQALAALRDAE
jgi:A/G-specific adenine glycosylase